MNQKKVIGILVIVLLIVIGGYVVWSKKKSAQNPIQNKNETAAINNQNQNSSAAPATSGASQDGSALSGVDEGASPDEKRSDEKPDETFRQQVMIYVNQNLNKLAAPPANDKWDVPTFYFVGNSNVYVELYGTDTDLVGVKMLYKAAKDANGAIKLTEVARYKEGNDDWILSSGTDTYSDYVMEEYDLNEDTQKWEKTDEFTDESYSEGDTGSSSTSPSGQIIQ